jgi:hypothetical protein
MSSQAPQPQQNQEMSHSMQYFLGLGIGLIPLILAMISIGTSSTTILFPIAPLLYLVMLIASVVCLIIQKVRFVGYGLLTMVCVTPVIAFIACIVLLSRV